MTHVSLGSILDALKKRNAALVAVYKEGSRTILSRSVSSLAASVADQRRDMGKDLLELAQAPGIDTCMVDFELDAAQLELPPAWNVAAINDFLLGMRDRENEDFELLATLSGGFTAIGIDLAERVAALADQARKRAGWAKDHLDLLGLN